MYVLHHLLGCEYLNCVETNTTDRTKTKRVDNGMLLWGETVCQSGQRNKIIASHTNLQ